MERYLEVQSGYSINAETGRILKEQPFYMASQRLYKAAKGDCLTVKDQAFMLGVATYSKEIREEYIYAYAYEEEQNWACYQGDFSEETFTIEKYIFTEDCWFRICLKKADGNWCIPEDAACVNEILAFHSDLQEELQIPFYFEQEIRKTVDSVRKMQCKGKSLVFALLTDSHYTTNGRWHQTVANLTEVHKRVGFDGIIHLGDLQDGMLDKTTCYNIAYSCINDMRQIC